MVKTSTNRNVDNQNVDKPKRRHTETSTDQNVDRLKRRQIKTLTCQTSTNQNVDRPKCRQTKASTNQNKPKRRPTKTSADQNVDKPKRRETETWTGQFSTLYSRVFVFIILGMYYMYIRAYVWLVWCTLYISTHNFKIIGGYSTCQYQQD